MDVVGLWRMSKAHSCLPDVLTAVNGVDIFCCVLWEKEEVESQKAGARIGRNGGTSKAVQPLSRKKQQRNNQTIELYKSSPTDLKKQVLMSSKNSAFASQG